MTYPPPIVNALTRNKTHLTWERYDLLSTEEAFYRRPTQAFFEMIKSDWLRHLIARVPGYDARETGLLTLVQPD